MINSYKDISQLETTNALDVETINKLNTQIAERSDTDLYQDKHTPESQF
ncbi:MAG: hypothetical protein IJA22_03100 [Clostridia bacterium]|nr:hypothetical protein [Clostridia bacterium]